MGLYRIEELLNFWSPGLGYYTIVLAIIRVFFSSIITPDRVGRIDRRSGSGFDVGDEEKYVHRLMITGLAPLCTEYVSPPYTLPATPALVSNPKNLEPLDDAICNPNPRVEVDQGAH